MTVLIKVLKKDQLCISGMSTVMCTTSEVSGRIKVCSYPLVFSETCHRDDWGFKMHGEGSCQGQTNSQVLQNTLGEDM